MDEFRDLDSELADLVLASLAGEASAEDIDRLNRLILDDPTQVGPIVETIAQDAWLSWCAVPDSRSEESSVLHLRSSDCSTTTTASQSAQGSGRPRRLNSHQFAIAGMLLIVGGMVGFWASTVLRPTIQERVAENDSHAAPHLSNELNPTLVGHVVRASACQWNSSVESSFLVGTSLRQGELLNLLEGVAELRFDRFHGVADLRVEGPAGLLLSDNGSVRLSHGKVTTEVSPGSTEFILETPNGMVRFSTAASVGVSALGMEVSVHVFEGSATVTAPWEDVQFGSSDFELRGGESLTLRRGSEGSLSVNRGLSQPEDFISRSSMQTDQLRIPLEYIQDVLALNPVLYWRFGDEGSDVLNFNGSGYAGHVEGKVRFARDGDNRYIDFRSGISQEEANSFLISDQPLPLTSGAGYAIELWFKPSHFHLGTMAALVSEPQESDAPPMHGMILELGGPWTNRQGSDHPGRVRFFHRGDPTDTASVGASCYSADLYELRRWQHLVAVKDRSSMRVYLDGDLAANIHDETMQTTELSLILGQLDAGSHERVFVGQLDEVAVYLEPLSAADVQRHFRLVRPLPAAQDVPLSTPGI